MCTTPCTHTQVRELLKNVRSGHSKRGVKPHKQAALTKEPLRAVLATCDDSPRGMRDRALLLFGWASGGRRRSEIAGATMENLRKVRIEDSPHEMDLDESRGLIKNDQTDPAICLSATSRARE
jgi:integrase